MPTKNINTTPVVEEEKKAPVKKTRSAVVANCNKVNFRKSAALDSEVISELDKDTTVVVINPGNEWCKVKVDDRVGFIMSEFLIIE